jgi:mannose-6-phosphate isomerase-like protein (cupin superfamily)
MKPHLRFAVVLALTASIVFLPAAAEPPVGGPERVVWAAMPVPETPYAPPNKVHTRIADILAAHRGQASWTVPVVRTAAFAGDYVSLAPGEATKAMFYSEERVVLWVHSGQMRVEIEGQPTTTVTKGFLVDVAPTLIFKLVNTGSDPAVFFRLTPFGQLPSYPSGESPMSVTGYEYVMVRMRPYGTYEPPNQPFLDFNEDIIAVNGPSRDFAMDGHTSAHIIRGEATPPPPDSDWGHFHANLPEVWLVIEGKIDLKVSGEPLVTGATFGAAQSWRRGGDREQLSHQTHDGCISAAGKAVQGRRQCRCNARGAPSESLGRFQGTCFARHSHPPPHGLGGWRAGWNSGGGFEGRYRCDLGLHRR